MRRDDCASDARTSASVVSKRRRCDYPPSKPRALQKGLRTFSTNDSQVSVSTVHPVCCRKSLDAIEITLDELMVSNMPDPRACNVTESVILSDRYRGVTVRS
jgi:hypothetical protein